MFEQFIGKLMKIGIPPNKYNNLSREQWGALYNLKIDKNIVIKKADKGSGLWSEIGMIRLKRLRNKMQIRHF